MTIFKSYLAVLISAVAVALGFSANSQTSVPSVKTVSATTEAARPVRSLKNLVNDFRRGRICEELKSYPRGPGAKLSFEIAEISPLCRSFVHGSRSSLDRCGDSSDRFHQSQSASTSAYTWPSHNEMLKKGRVNLYTDASLKTELPKFNTRIEEIRTRAADLCCGSDVSCRAGMSAVEVSVCEPPADGNISDPCVHGGAFEMAGRNYTSIFASARSRYTRDEESELRTIATKNLPIRERGPTSDAALTAPLGGKIVLTSYVRKDQGVAALEPTLQHEFGHACTMVKMQVQAGLGQEKETRSKALTALRWFDQVKNRCERGQDSQLPAYADFWESVGESRELAACFAKITDLNREELIDKACVGLCPGHYMEETVGVAFSLLTGDLTGELGSVFPNTCDHMRDSQHPMVADVVECLAQYSPRFRSRLGEAYGCELPVMSKITASLDGVKPTAH